MNVKIIFILLFFVIQIHCPGNSKPKVEGELVEWESFNSGLKKAKDQKKSIIIDFYADWCHWCKVMDKETFANKEVLKILSRDFIAIRLNMDKSENITYMGMKTNTSRFATAIGVRGLPSIAFMDKEGNLIDMVPGYIKPDIFTGILRYVKEECYKKQVSFQDFMDKKTDCK